MPVSALDVSQELELPEFNSHAEAEQWYMSTMRLIHTYKCHSLKSYLSRQAFCALQSAYV